MLKISTAPHMHTDRTTASLMRDVVIALLPAAVAAVLFFGVGALKVILTSVAGCVLFEYLAGRYWFKTGNTTRDFSAVITGLLLAFNLPSTMPILMILVGCFIAIVVAKLCYGGLGRTRVPFYFLSRANDDLAQTGLLKLFFNRCSNRRHDFRNSEAP